MAVDRNPEVMEMVEEELLEDPEISNRDLKLKAEEIDEEIGSLSARQFNARYPLQVKRKLSAERDGGDGDRRAGADGRRGDDENASSGAEDPGDGRDTRERIMSLVRRLLRKDEDVSTREMQERAVEVDPGVEELSTRQFHARYPLQVMRRMSSRTSTSDGEDTGDSDSGDAVEERREAVRRALLDFARDVAGAEDRGEVIDVLTDVDEYVDRIVEDF